MKERPHHRLKRAREAAGYTTAAAFAEAYGLPESTYRSAENGTRGMKYQAAQLYARLLKIDWRYLLDGSPNPEMKAPVIGYVGAGDTIFSFDDENAFDPVPLPPGMISGLAAIVRGNSMEPVYRDRDMLFCDPQERAVSDLVGSDCLVQVSDGRRLVKALRRGKKRGYFRLYSYASNSESEDTRIEWAAPVRWVMRR